MVVFMAYCTKYLAYMDVRACIGYHPAQEWYCMGAMRGIQRLGKLPYPRWQGRC